MFFFKKPRKVDVFATRFAEELYSNLPPAIIEKHRLGQSRKATKQFEENIENMVAQIAQFKSTVKPGIYGRAKLHLVFANRLKELGYPDDVVNDINSYILTRTP